jgi:exosome complex RNA-binding protein Rrp4
MQFEFTRTVDGQTVTSIEERELEDVRTNLNRIAMEKDYIYAIVETLHLDGTITFTLKDRQLKTLTKWKQI